MAVHLHLPEGVGGEPVVVVPVEYHRRTATDAGLTQQPGATITVANLRIDVVEAVSLNEANAVTTLAANVSGSAQAFSFRDAATLLLDTVDGITGITTNAANITLDVDAGTLTQDTGEIIQGSGLELLTDGSITLNEANDIDSLAASLSARRQP